MKVAITGGAGYVGSLLVRAHLERGDSVHVVARNPAALAPAPEVTVHVADVTASECIPDEFFANADVVYHCAAEIMDEALMHAVNVTATRRLLERARGRVGRWVQLSSLSVYGTPRDGVIDEETPSRPRSVYARTKVESDEIVESMARGAFGYTLVRPAAVVGPRMRNASMRALVDAVPRGRFCFIGARGAIGNYVHEENMVQALLLCATCDAAKDRTYNLAQNVTLEAMVAAIATALRRPVPQMRVPETLARTAAQIACLIPSFPLTPARVDALTSRVEYRTDRIERELGYRHRASVEDALREIAAARTASAS